ncbi:MAG: hypothetical protein C0594_00525 [Marinilabiliales bacterium]|nr:MAG: hypothetical protein C0594_00525 [Marinilabiliales bacterium]
MRSGYIKLGDIVKSFSVKAKDYATDVSKLEFFGVSNVDGITKSKYAAEDKAEDYKILEKGCFAYNQYRINVGSIAMLEEDIVGLISPAYVVFKVKDNTIVPELLLKYLRSHEGLRQIKLHARGTVRQALRFKDLCDIELSLPDYEVQKKLYKSFSEIEKACHSASKEFEYQLSLVKQLSQAFLREAMEGKLTRAWREEHPELLEGENSATALLERIKAEKEQLIKEKKIKRGKLQEAETLDELLFEIPESWEWCNLDQISKRITDGTHQTPTYTRSGRIFLSGQNVKPFRFMPEEHKYVSEEAYQTYIKNRKPEKGDLLIGRVGAGIGETAVIDQEIDFCIYVSLGLVQPFKEFVDSDYLAYVFNSPYGYSYAKGNISSKGGSAGNFNLGRIRSFLIPFPSLTEQHKIVERLDSLMVYCDSLEASIRSSQAQNEMLLGQVLREALEG